MITAEWDINVAQKVWRQEGWEDGLEEGIEKGIEKKAFEATKKMLGRGMALSDIADILELSIDKIQIFSKR